MTSARQRSQFAEESAVQHAHTTLSLDRFDNETRGILTIQDGVQLLQVPLRDRNPPRKRPEWRAIRWPICRCKRGEQSPVKRTAQGNDLVLGGTTSLSSCPPTNELEGPLVRLSTGVAEEHL